MKTCGICQQPTFEKPDRTQQSKTIITNSGEKICVFPGLENSEPGLCHYCKMVTDLETLPSKDGVTIGIFKRNPLVVKNYSERMIGNEPDYCRYVQQRAKSRRESLVGA